MPKLARLYLDTARLGLMSPSAQLAARDFARLAGEGVSTLYFQNLLRGQVPLANTLAPLPGFADWQGIEGLKERFRRLLRLPTRAPVLFAGRAISLMRWAARQLWRRCHRILIPDTAWPPYVRILEEERLRCGGELVPTSIRDLVHKDQANAGDVVSRLTEAYRRHGCDGLFWAAVSHDGIRIRTAPLLSALRRRSQVRFAVIDGAQELAHVPADLAAPGSDVWLAGAHKWLGGHQPLGIACLANSDSSRHLLQAAIADCRTRLSDDPLLRFLLRLEGHDLPDVRETVNLAPLFSTWGALRDIPMAISLQEEQLERRQANAVLVNRLAARHGWKPLATCPSLTTGIALLQANDPALRRLPTQDLEAAIESAGVMLTALDGGRLRLSMPIRPLEDEQQFLLGQALTIGRSPRFARAAIRATQSSCPR